MDHTLPRILRITQPIEETNSNSSSMIADHPAIKFSFSIREGQYNLRGWTLFMLKDEKGYLILYFANPKAFYDDSLMVQNMINAFVRSSMQSSPDLVGLKVGHRPYDLAVNPVTNKIYVLNQGSGTVSVIDGYSERSDTNITVGSNTTAQLTAIAVDQYTNSIYVADDSGKVYIINGATNTFAHKPINVGGEPGRIVVSPFLDDTFVTNMKYNNISMIQPAVNNSVVDRDAVGYYSIGIALMSSRGCTWQATVLMKSLS